MKNKLRELPILRTEMYKQLYDYPGFLPGKFQIVRNETIDLDQCSLDYFLNEQMKHYKKRMKYY